MEKICEKYLGESKGRLCREALQRDTLSKECPVVIKGDACPFGRNMVRKQGEEAFFGGSVEPVYQEDDKHT